MDNHIHILAQNGVLNPVLAPAMAGAGAVRILAGAQRFKTWNPSKALYGSGKNNSRLTRS